MSSRSELNARLARHLILHQRVFDPVREPRNHLRSLKTLQAWQARRLERSFRAFLEHPRRRSAALFFLTDVYGEQDFRQRDADIARVVPKMQRLLPAALVATVADGVLLGALSHALDLRMAQALDGCGKLTTEAYARAYRTVGHPRLRARQIQLIGDVGRGLNHALTMPGVGTLLRLSRHPAQAAGLGKLQSFLERGYAAFAELADAEAFLAAICEGETVVMARLLAGDPYPFGWRCASASAK